MNRNGFTLIELMAVLTIVALVGIVTIPVLLDIRCHGAPRASCANNLKQIGTALNLYESVPGHDCFPVDSLTPDPMSSLGMLFRDYVTDPRVFSCASHPTIDKLAGLTAGSKNPVVGNLTSSMSGYGYDCGYGSPNTPHNSGDSIAIVCADILKGSPVRNISGNHKGAGINVLLCSGSVEWRAPDSTGSISNDCGKDCKSIEIIDPDIYASNSLPTAPNLDSNVRP